ncbi:uncharacterized protein FIBRA_00155 [Fibroporia radiculosa]|uniref:Exocyst complex component Sec3 PIP2-binding N-terminal domain-containing protein n=1 Tax=Fibroporia radiculosa TaxID=599839 RepID=J7SBW0_9APHY|nr:uncharacterized protein FIBRA_00155 [Fibroporia radiculosa]CCL98161.1 predicted protein [Fibroporia radiculosa]
MGGSDSIQQKIESSVFVKLNSSGRPFEEHYVAHIKIWEAAQDGKGRKSRYIILSQASDKSGYIHKAKLNCNGAFSVGKTWPLEELREVEVVNSLVFEITPSATTYRWQADNPKDQAEFVASLIKLFQTVTGGAVPLRLIGVKMSDGVPAAKPSPPHFGSTRLRRPPTTESDKTAHSGTSESAAADSLEHASTKPVSRNPPIVIWKRPVDVSQLPPFPPTPLPTLT